MGRISGLRDELFARLCANLPGVRLNGHPERRLPGTLNVSFRGLDVGDLLGALPDVAASAGSACASLNSGPSHVLKATGLADEMAATVRFGLGRFTTSEEVERAARLAVRASKNLEASVMQPFAFPTVGMCSGRR